MTEHQLDAKRLLCPMPVIRVQDAMKTMQSGDILCVECTDPGTKADIPAWCHINGHVVLAMETCDSMVTFRLQVG